MLWFLIMVGVLWGLGHLMKTPTSMRLTMIGILYLGVLLTFVALPAGNGLRLAFGGGLREWLVLGGVVGLIAGYRYVLRALRRRAHVGAGPSQHGIDASELERNARHIVLREIGGPGQARLKAARVLVIGAGGLGSPALQYLAAAGVGTIGVIDDDVVENSNLARQVIHKDAAIGMPKVFSAQTEMQAQNPHITVRPYHRRLLPNMAAELFRDYDLVLDGTDNFDTRYLVNSTCVALKIPLISAALSQWEGQISTFHPAKGGPCYQCIFPTAPAPGLAPSCAEGGVLGPLPGVLGAMMAVEAVKLIAQAGEGLVGRMMIYDALYGENRVVKVGRRKGCEVCGGDQEPKLEAPIAHLTKRSKGQHNPKNWVNEGDGLLQSSIKSRAVWDDHREHFGKNSKAGTSRPEDWSLLTGLPRSSMLLLGYSVEMYLKAGLAKAYIGCSEDMFVRDIKSRFGHKQYSMARELDFPFGPVDQTDFGLLKSLVLIDARYPVALKDSESYSRAVNEQTSRIWSGENYQRLLELANRVRKHVLSIDQDPTNPAFHQSFNIDNDGYFAFRSGGNLPARITYRLSSLQKRNGLTTVSEVKKLFESEQYLQMNRFFDQAKIYEDREKLDGTVKTILHSNE